MIHRENQWIIAYGPDDDLVLYAAAYDEEDAHQQAANCTARHEGCEVTVARPVAGVYRGRP